MSIILRQFGFSRFTRFTKRSTQGVGEGEQRETQENQAGHRLKARGAVIDS